MDAVLVFMSRLYEQDGITGYDAGRARGATEELLANRDLGGAWLIQAEGLAIGYLVLTIGYSLELGGRFGLLDEFYIEEGWRGQGVGTEALAFAESVCRARGLGALRLEVGHGNIRALALYRRFGFEVHDRHLMTKWL